MIPQLEGRGMGIQIALLAQVGFMILADIMVEKGDRYNEGGEAIIIVGDDLEEFLFFVWREDLLKISHHMLQYIHMFLDGRLQFQGLQEEGLVVPIALFKGGPFSLSH